MGDKDGLVNGRRWSVWIHYMYAYMCVREIFYCIYQVRVLLEMGSTKKNIAKDRTFAAVDGDDRWF